MIAWLRSGSGGGASVAADHVCRAPGVSGCPGDMASVASSRFESSAGALVHCMRMLAERSVWLTNTNLFTNIWSKETRGVQVLACVIRRNRMHHWRTIAAFSPIMATFLVKPPPTYTGLNRLV